MAGGGRVVYAVDGVSFSLAPGEVLGLVGESGSGKTTVGYCINRLLEPTDGTIRLDGEDITHLSRRELRPFRRRMHIVFQDPYSSLNPRMTCGQIVGEPIRLHRIARRSQLESRVTELFDAVGLRQELRHRYPHELSGGQRQRVGLARALSVSPTLLIADEPVSALDVSVQASVLNLLRDLQREFGFSCLFISHDLATVEFLCDRVAVMYLGKIVELAPRDELFARPAAPVHPGAPVGGPRARSRRSANPPARRARGRHPQPERASVRLSFPDALPARAGIRAALDRGGACLGRRHRAGAPRRLPPRPARARRTAPGVRPCGARGDQLTFTTRPELRGTFGMVASTHWLASAVGMSVLERGGNAFDAAVATGFTLQVVEPHLNGPGGDLPGRASGAPSAASRSSCAPRASLRRPPRRSASASSATS